MDISGPRVWRSRSWPASRSTIIGGVIAIFVSGATLSVTSLVGFITVAGISARDSIMMLSHYHHLMAHEGEEFGER